MHSRGYLKRRSKNNFTLFFHRVLWRQWRDIPGHIIHNSIRDSLCGLVTSHKQVTKSFILCRAAGPAEWKCFLERLTFFSAQLMSVCWQLSSHCLVKIPFIWMKLSSENKQREEIGGSLEVSTKPNYYSSNWREETLRCSPSDPSWRRGCPLQGCSFMPKPGCWTYLIYRNFKSQNGTDRWTCSRANPWPQEVLSEKSRSKPISYLTLTAASESTLLKVKVQFRKNCWKLWLV